MIDTTQRRATEKPLCLAILAMGGQGGGVLADWIIALAESEGWAVQATSVPGVAQRTGATLYYLEMLPLKDGRAPVLSLMPTPGDVDVVLAAELMEAGRSVLRGLVTPDRTTLIASTHRSFAIAEKERPGDGLADPLVVVDATDFAAKRTIAFDMDELASRNGSFISATMFGALAASNALPFSREAFEKAIGENAHASLKAFRAAFERAVHQPREAPVRAPTKRFDPLPTDAGHAELNSLVARIRAFPDTLHAMLFAGVKRLVDFQDAAYAGEYLDRLTALHAEDRRADGEPKGFGFTREAAKYVASAMAYDDVIRVADLKIRASRTERVRREIKAADGQILYTTEFMHPRMEEVCGALPARLGAWIEARASLYQGLDRLVSRPRRVKPGTLFWFFGLYCVAGLRSRRRGNLRHAREMAALEKWLACARETLPRNYDLAVEIIGARRLVKGYSGTHARGLSKFDRVMGAVPQLVAREDGGAWLRRLKTAALQDEDGVALDGALKTIETF